MDVVSIAESLSGPFGYAILFLITLALSAVLFLPVPVFLVVATAATVLDPFWVGVVAGIGSAIGELSGYFIGVGSEKALKKRGKEGYFYEQSRRLFRRYGFWGIAGAAVFPITPIDLVGLIAGALRYGWKKFLAAAIIGKVPRYLIVAYAGKAAIDTSYTAISENPVWALVVTLSILGLISFYYFWVESHGGKKRGGKKKGGKKGKSGKECGEKEGQPGSFRGVNFRRVNFRF